MDATKTIQEKKQTVNCESIWYVYVSYNDIW